jgi:hypothetical protein
VFKADGDGQPRTGVFLTVVIVRFCERALALVLAIEGAAEFADVKRDQRRLRVAGAGVLHKTKVFMRGNGVAQELRTWLDQVTSRYVEVRSDVVVVPSWEGPAKRARVKSGSRGKSAPRAIRTARRRSAARRSKSGRH